MQRENDVEKVEDNNTDDECEEEEDEAVGDFEGKCLLPLLRSELLVPEGLELRWRPGRGFGVYATRAVTVDSVLFIDHPIVRCSREHLSRDVRELCLETKKIPSLLNFFHPRSKLHPAVETYRLRHYADSSTPFSLQTKMAMLHARIALNGFAVGDQIVVNTLATFVNHSCRPNSIPRATETWPEETPFVAIRDIAQDEELTIPYQLKRDATDGKSHRMFLWRKYRIRCDCGQDEDEEPPYSPEITTNPPSSDSRLELPAKLL
eukprot:TRINITY_DN12964_c0_g1_i1.p1 TRINITY_DN12964_c0_g1~~TRINITY_DN12964_c0_g1_i1.p1  ORF type:complete len:263 (+),score=55.73 TRINITY_DN12964_c0_g1_i1:243-1031(+)